jgi:hypothetical protein
MQKVNNKIGIKVFAEERYARGRPLCHRAGEPSLRSSQKPESHAMVEEEEQVPLHTKPNNNTKVPDRLAIQRRKLN